MVSPSAGPASLLALSAAVLFSGHWDSLDFSTLSAESTGLRELSPGPAETTNANMSETCVESEPMTSSIRHDASDSEAMGSSGAMSHILTITAGIDAVVFVLWMLSRVRYRWRQSGDLASGNACGRPTLETEHCPSSRAISEHCRTDAQVAPLANDIFMRKSSSDLAEEPKKQLEMAKDALEAGVEISDAAPVPRFQGSERQCLQAEPLPEIKPLGCTEGCTATCDHRVDVSPASQAGLPMVDTRRDSNVSLAVTKHEFEVSMATGRFSTCSDMWANKKELQSVPEHDSIDYLGTSDERTSRSSQLQTSSVVELRDVLTTSKQDVRPQNSKSIPRRRVKIRGLTERYLLKCGLRFVPELLLLSHSTHSDLSSKLLRKSFFAHLLGGTMPLRNMPANDVAAAQWDLRYLGLETLLELRVRHSDLVTESRSHEAHSSFLASLDRQLFEHLAWRLLTVETLQSSAPLPGKEVLQKLGLQFALVLGAAESLPRPGAKALGSRDAVEAPPSIQHENIAASNDEELQLLQELEVIRADIREEKRLQEEHAELSWRRFCRRCCWALPLADGVWPSHSLVLLCGTDKSGCASARAKVLVGDSAEEIAAAAAGRAVAVIWDQSKSSESPRQVFWEVKFLDPERDDVLGEISKSRDSGQCDVQQQMHAQELAAALERRRNNAAAVAAPCILLKGMTASEKCNPHRSGLLTKDVPTPSRAFARVHAQNRAAER
eukprot:TRINITY_DN25141_c0_g1_i1.p1 TRINITY_DN25141_c0_g1~~TRINITY_DN25141_c0_g1_i1.p1  ORF type:complete len:722 (+),score=122.35 TRINITY_DN25141_c0_g1_i1:68-2233(+)